MPVARTKSTRGMRVVPTQPQESQQQEPSIAPELQESGWISDDMYNFGNISPALQMIYAEIGIDGGVETTIHVTKLDALGKGEEARVFSGVPEDYNLEQIARTHGSGKYRVKVYMRSMDGNKKPLRGSRIFNWKLSPAEEAELQNQGKPEQQSQYVTVAQMELILDRLTARMQPEPKQFDPMAMMQSMATMITTLMPKPVATPASDPVEIVKLALELSERMMPEERPEPRATSANGNDVVVAMIQHFGPGLSAIIQENITRNAMLAKQGGQGMLQISPVTGVQTDAQGKTIVTTGPSQPIETQEQQPENPKEVEALRKGIAFLIAQAGAGNPVETYAELVIDNLPHEELMLLLESPDPVEVLIMFEPDVAKYQEWFKELLDNVKQLLSDNPLQADSKEPSAT